MKIGDIGLLPISDGHGRSEFPRTGQGQAGIGQRW
jgi:hypothetical protein